MVRAEAVGAIAALGGSALRHFAGFALGWRMNVFAVFNRTVRYDWLAHQLFDTLDEIQTFATRLLWTYNHDRSNMALGDLTPKQKSALAA